MAVLDTKNRRVPFWQPDGTERPPEGRYVVFFEDTGRPFIGRFLKKQPNFIISQTGDKRIPVKYVVSFAHLEEVVDPIPALGEPEFVAPEPDARRNFHVQFDLRFLGDPEDEEFERRAWDWLASYMGKLNALGYEGLAALHKPTGVISGKFVGERKVNTQLTNNSFFSRWIATADYEEMPACPMCGAGRHAQRSRNWRSTRGYGLASGHPAYGRTPDKLAYFCTVCETSTPWVDTKQQAAIFWNMMCWMSGASKEELEACFFAAAPSVEAPTVPQGDNYLLYYKPWVTGSMDAMHRLGVRNLEDLHNLRIREIQATLTANNGGYIVDHAKVLRALFRALASQSGGNDRETFKSRVFNNLPISRRDGTAKLQCWKDQVDAEELFLDVNGYTLLMHMEALSLACQGPLGPEPAFFRRFLLVVLSQFGGAPAWSAIKQTISNGFTLRELTRYVNFDPHQAFDEAAQGYEILRSLLPPYDIPMPVTDGEFLAARETEEQLEADVDFAPEEPTPALIDLATIPTALMSMRFVSNAARPAGVEPHVWRFDLTAFERGAIRPADAGSTLDLILDRAADSELAIDEMICTWLMYAFIQWPEQAENLIHDLRTEDLLLCDSDATQMLNIATRIREARNPAERNPAEVEVVVEEAHVDTELAGALDNIQGTQVPPGITLDAHDLESIRSIARNVVELLYTWGRREGQEPSEATQVPPGCDALFALDHIFVRSARNMSLRRFLFACLHSSTSLEANWYWGMANSVDAREVEIWWNARNFRDVEDCELLEMRGVVYGLMEGLGEFNEEQRNWVQEKLRACNIRFTAASWSVLCVTSTCNMPDGQDNIDFRVERFYALTQMPT